MLRKGFPQSSRPRAVEIVPLSAGLDVANVDLGRHPAATNRSDRHSMSMRRASSGGMHFASKRILRCRLAFRTLL